MLRHTSPREGRQDTDGMAGNHSEALPRGTECGGMGAATGVLAVIPEGLRRFTHSSPLSTYSAQGGLRQGPVGAAQSLTDAGTCGNGRFT